MKKNNFNRESIMKSRFIYPAVVLFAMLCFSGCCQKDYSLVLLGDIHYDHPKYHDSNALKFTPKVPYSVGTKNKEGFFSWRNHTLWVTESQADTNHNIPLNAKMWEKDVPEILDNAAACAEKNKSVYAIQLGDMIHGDCGRLELHQANLRDAVSEMDKRFACPVLLTSGNHDPRNTYGQEAWDSVIPPYLASIVRNYSGKRGNYAVNIGKDLFVFYDLNNPDLDYLEKVFKDNPKSRYTFFVSHAPLFPTGKGAIFEIISDDYDRLFSLLEKREVIVLSGHTHHISLSEYKNRKSNRTMSQFVINSTVRAPEKQLDFVPGTHLHRAVFPKKPGRHLELWQKYFEGNIKTTLHTHGSGYALLRVTDKGVFVDYRNLGQDKYHTWQLR